MVNGSADASHHPYSKWRIAAVVAGALLLLGAILISCGVLERKYTPPKGALAPPAARHAPPAFDVWGRSISRAEADEMRKTEEGRAALSPANGAVEITDDLLKLGEKTYYEETFANEVFLTDVLGMLDGRSARRRSPRRCWR